MDLVSRKQKVQPTYLRNDPADWKFIWKLPIQQPTEHQLRKLMSLYLAKVTQWIMKNHKYTFFSSDISKGLKCFD